MIAGQHLIFAIGFTRGNRKAIRIGIIRTSKLSADFFGQCHHHIHPARFFRVREVDGWECAIRLALFLHAADVSKTDIGE
ncbi:Uncharacterised protein [Vibrio cholerae]|uniref:Uncharacterized protein n=1 Tax=Vibrio cholerae TaxID=666 RepID=A0A655YTT5_VIBCL|nr:Uncharacterised protein [Vibrio cholerae]CSA31011.1 Uncharacterised protein [Vibrio cholerae]CSC48269.1 Uncharacterised protein [Vibrio cholerae]